ncbi:hypothetical protein Adu01nite_80070 [Paractinoplanes durhamensis]|uniref:Uncharacterized protein n=1 Tax=Paractinoplanes durhamensis TaxID=113563 RepID=A0ABQ3ZA29_9ACTN|nr:hypothetical protein Adu01nite_80070 [Actinoplanes durhamensis]
MPEQATAANDVLSPARTTATAPVVTANPATSANTRRRTPMAAPFKTNVTRGTHIVAFTFVNIKGS